jgi:hypothetical protein
MKDCNDLNFVRRDCIEYCEWKTAYDRSPQAAINDGEQTRIKLNLRERKLDTLHEIQIQVLALVRIPLAGLGEFGIRFRREAKIIFV